MERVSKAEAELGSVFLPAGRWGEAGGLTLYAWAPRSEHDLRSEAERVGAGRSHKEPKGPPSPPSSSGFSERLRGRVSA